jgi:hypothetical protein
MDNLVFMQIVDLESRCRSLEELERNYIMDYQRLEAQAANLRQEKEKAETVAEGWESHSRRLQLELETEKHEHERIIDGIQQQHNLRQANFERDKVQAAIRSKPVNDPENNILLPGYCREVR